MPSIANAYLFTSERLGFRPWTVEDLDAMAAINADPEVMAFFPNTQSRNETLAFIERMQQHQAENGFCYFAVETLDPKALIGFTGICKKEFEADFTPCIDIGWRLAKSFWHKGYAAEGAGRCLQYAFETLKIKQIYSMAPAINLPSITVMQRIGMQYLKNFDHPQLPDDKRLQDCVLYVISN